jgi:hypothetical protein
MIARTGYVNPLDGVTRVTGLPLSTTANTATGAQSNAGTIVRTAGGGVSVSGQPVPALSPPGMAHFQYFVKIVPTQFVDSSGRIVAHSHQFSVTEHAHHLTPALSVTDMDSHKLPGLFILYDLSPFMVRVESYSVSFSNFFTSVCAIVGGVLTVAGIVDSLLYHGSKTAAKVATKLVTPQTGTRTI